MKAQSVLGAMYSKGDGVPKSAADAAKWLDFVSKSGDAEALHRVAIMYGDNKGASQSDKEVAK